MSTKILAVGTASLREVAESVSDFHDPVLTEEASALRDAIRAFREEHGFGRAIAAPQIGIAKRMVGLALPGWPEVILNPEIVWRSDERMTLWDDCMCFPEMLVKVERHVSISVRYATLAGDVQLKERLPRDIAELMQHEIDHLDGNLSFDRAAGVNPYVHRSVFDADPAAFGKLVDYFPHKV